MSKHSALSSGELPFLEKNHPCILTIAGSDSGGGAGIQADLKTMTVLGGYGLSVITALTAQNTTGVEGISAPEPEFVALQLHTVLEDFPVRAAKTGMLFSAPIIRALVPLLAKRTFPLVVDPVCVSQSGQALLQEDAVEALRTEFLPLADLLTPNRPEAERLTGMSIDNEAGIAAALDTLLAMGPKAVLLKGGHFQGEVMTDWLGLPGRKPVPLSSARIPTRNTHGTGCTLSAAIATFLGSGLPLDEAVAKGREYLLLALQTGYDLGSGHGPVNHLAPLVRTRGKLDVLEELHRLGEKMTLMPGLGKLVPEVRMNVALAAPFARGVHDVAAFEGRISASRDGHILIAGCPRFGASSHMAKVVLTAARKNPEIRAAANICFSEFLLSALDDAGLKHVGFSRAEEPLHIKEQEGSTLEWGTGHALNSCSDPTGVDAVWDRGERGKEPMIRLLARDGQDLLDKLSRVLAVLKEKEEEVSARNT